MVRRKDKTGTGQREILAVEAGSPADKAEF
jgi:hypothetical protein